MTTHELLGHYVEKLEKAQAFQQLTLEMLAGLKAGKFSLEQLTVGPGGWELKPAAPKPEAAAKPRGRRGVPTTPNPPNPVAAERNGEAEG